MKYDYLKPMKEQLNDQIWGKSLTFKKNIAILNLFSNDTLLFKCVYQPYGYIKSS